LPPCLGAPVCLLLIRPEARLLHAQVGARARRSERKSHHALQIEGRVVVGKIPSVGQRPVRLDREDLAVQHAAPVAAQIEAVAHGWLEVVLHEPLLDQVWLRERAPHLFRRMRDLAFDNDGERLGRSFVHWSILLSRSSRSSNRRPQNPAIWPVQSISGAKALSWALSCVWRPSWRSRTSPACFKTPRCFETAGCEILARAVSAPTVCSPSRHSRSKRARRVGSASVLKSTA